VKILHVTTHWFGGGSDRNIAHNLECLVAAGQEVHLAVGQPFIPHRQPVPDGVIVHHVAALRRAPHVLRDLTTVASLYRLVRREHYDVVHTHLAKAGFCGRLAARAAGATSVHTVHGPSTVSRRVYRVLDRALAKSTSCFVFVGEELRTVYGEAIGVDGSLTRVIRSPVGVERLAALRSSKRAMRATRLGVLIVSRLSIEKGLDLLPRIAEALPEVDFELAGDGPFRERLEQERAERGLGNVRLLGHVDTFGPLGQCDVLLHLGRVEGVPQAVVQAIASGCPVVAADCCGLSECVVDGRNGIVLGTDVAEAAVESLRRLHRDRHFLAALAEGARATDVSAWERTEIERQQLSLVEELGPRA
jgi:glycosyltransferase involved in cell wall biosynthesis